MFIRDGHRVILAGTGRSGELLKKTFPEIPFLNLPSPRVRLGGSQNSIIQLCLQIPGFIISVFREHRIIVNLVRKHGIEIIVSDNRYGLFCKGAYSVFVTHQISPVMPAGLRWLEYPLYRIIRHLIGCYNECWIPDFENPVQNLSGRLSHRYKLPKNVRFIGILSRFTKMQTISHLSADKDYALVAVLSGPEPQASEFEDLICGQLKHAGVTSLIIRAFRGETIKQDDGGITLISHLDTPDFARILKQAQYVICRAGYSAIMDLITLGISAILVPTPGQSEQEYLAQYLEEKKWFRMVPQNDLDLPDLIHERLMFYKPDFTGYQDNVLESCLRDLYGKNSGNGKKSYDKT